MATSNVPPLVYDPRYHTFNSWASLMCELYADQQLTIPSDSIDWKAWASALKGIDSFAREAVPDPALFDDWSDWATVLVGAVNPARA